MANKGEKSKTSGRAAGGGVARKLQFARRRRTKEAGVR